MEKAHLEHLMVRVPTANEGGWLSLIRNALYPSLLCVYVCLCVSL